MTVTCGDENPNLMVRGITHCIFSAKSLLLKDFELNDAQHCTDKRRILGCGDLLDHPVSTRYTC